MQATIGRGKDQLTPGMIEPGSDYFWELSAMLGLFSGEEELEHTD